ncbi:hypothetical protein AB0C12_16605 [Actinoplanes sp. NPDC048967]|uniref:hypothetical protein n=1 Tax=Actinoplanes sp. NPDC048967 TaxID=3155269 RepID=UPI0033D2E94D
MANGTALPLISPPNPTPTTIPAPIARSTASSCLRLMVQTVKNAPTTSAGMA